MPSSEMPPFSVDGQLGREAAGSGHQGVLGEVEQQGYWRLLTSYSERQARLNGFTVTGGCV